MSDRSALLTFSIGPVHTFIAQARRVADLWAGSALLSHLIRTAIDQVIESQCSMLFPYVERPIPDGLPNRFVCRVPLDDANDCAERLETAVRNEWKKNVADAVDALGKVGIVPSPAIWPGDPPSGGQTDAALEIAWSWVPEDGGYKAASDAGARQFAASRMYRSFTQIREPGHKCAVCGERTALPDGDRKNLTQWPKAEERAKERDQLGFFRSDQTRFCLVCATKRLFPLVRKQQARFASFQDFEPRADDDDDDDRDFPYFAVVTMDGDKIGQLLAGTDTHTDDELEQFHKNVSKTLTKFANSLRTETPALNLETLGYTRAGSRDPQLIYAGGEDVLFICDPRDAIPLARAVRKHYKTMFESWAGFTISAAVLFAHTKYPAGLLFHEADDLLARKAKRDAGRDAIAIRLRKRGGVPVEVAFKWDEGPSGTSDRSSTWLDLLHGPDGLVSLLEKSELASRQSYILVKQANVLRPLFTNELDLWIPWLTNALSGGEAFPGSANEIAGKLAPLFIHEKLPALRIARFLAQEVPA